MDPRALRISDFTYDLPADRIAQHPLADRDASKLLVYRDGRITDASFKAIASHLPPGALLVLNDTRVVKARIIFHRSTGARIECMVLEPEHDRPMEEALLDRGTSRWWCMVGNAKRWTGEVLTRVEGPDRLSATREAVNDGEHLVTFSFDPDRTFSEVLSACGQVPLPPYMKRAEAAEDAERYNTLFATHEGSVAAPTASLHFTNAVLDDLAGRGVNTARVTLHVGAGTFLPVKSERMEGHAMHTERIRVPRSSVEALLNGSGTGPIVPVGTTALRTIESLCWFGDDLLAGGDPDGLYVDQWRPYAGDVPPARASLQAVLDWMHRHGAVEVTGQTSLLIAPGYRFRLADALVTNFHQPGSTLLLLVAAFLGDAWRDIYAHALQHDYRFLSYGDASLVWRTK